MRVAIYFLGLAALWYANAWLANWIDSDLLLAAILMADTLVYSGLFRYLTLNTKENQMKAFRFKLLVPAEDAERLATNLQLVGASEVVQGIDHVLYTWNGFEGPDAASRASIKELGSMMQTETLWPHLVDQGDVDELVQQS